MKDMKSLFEQRQKEWEEQDRYEKVPKFIKGGLRNPKKRTERGDLLDWFLTELNPPRKAKGIPPLGHKRLAYLLTGIPTKDLYALQSKMRDARIPASAVFWLEIKPPKRVP